MLIFNMASGCYPQLVFWYRNTNLKISKSYNARQAFAKPRGVASATARAIKQTQETLKRCNMEVASATEACSPRVLPVAART